jgi:hypothetical protein
MKIEINDYEMVDKIVFEHLKTEIKGISKDIQELKRKKKLQWFQKEDLESHSKYLNALKTVRDYMSS